MNEIKFFTYRDQSTSSRSTQCNRFLGTSCDGSEFLDRLFGDAADLLGPLGALGVGGVATGLILTLLLIHSFTFNNIIFNIMFFLLGPALALVLCPADLLPVGVAVLDQRRPADLDRLLRRPGLVGEEAILDVVVVAFLLLEKKEDVTSGH